MSGSPLRGFDHQNQPRRRSKAASVGGLFRVRWSQAKQLRAFSGPPRPPTTQTYGGDPAPGFCILPLWADISFSNARGWARTCSIGFRRPRRTTPISMPMRPSSASPAPGFISSTRKPANSSARTDADNRMRACPDTGPRFKFTFILFLRNGFRGSA
jgi:hypothetical protein